MNPTIHASGDNNQEMNWHVHKHDLQHPMKEIIRQQKEYVDTHEDYLAQKGFMSGDKRLTTGRIELARLDSDLTKAELLDKIKDYNNIQSFFLS